jgi:hypothetical protein
VGSFISRRFDISNHLFRRALRSGRAAVFPQDGKYARNVCRCHRGLAGPCPKITFVPVRSPRKYKKRPRLEWNIEVIFRLQKTRREAGREIEWWLTFPVLREDVAMIEKKIPAAFLRCVEPGGTGAALGMRVEILRKNKAHSAACCDFSTFLKTE